MDPDGKTLLYGSFRPVNGQSINNKDKRQIPEPCGPPKPSGMTFAFCFCLLLSLKKPWRKVFSSSFVVTVILESRSPGSVVIKQGKIAPLFGLYTQDDLFFHKVVIPESCTSYMIKPRAKNRESLLKHSPGENKKLTRLLLYLTVKPEPANDLHKSAAVEPVGVQVRKVATSL